MEVCSSILAVKYLFKYCFKGHDCAYIKLSNINFNEDDENQQNVPDHDEIKQYLDTRYVCTLEACHRIFEFPIHNLSHAIHRLAVHLEGEKNLYFIEGEEKARLSKNIDSTQPDSNSIKKTSMQNIIYIQKYIIILFIMYLKKFENHDKNSINRFFVECIS